MPTGSDREASISHYLQLHKGQLWDGCELRNLSTVGRKAGVPSVVVLSYQRCGSSFYGNMFNTNPSGFNMFEPLDSVYSSLYGTKHGYNAPSDIYSYSNGTQRLVPDVELDAVSRFLTDMFSCDISRFPTDTVYHTFWTQMAHYFSSASIYIRCLRTRTGFSKPRMCDKFNPFHCGSRFGEKPEEKLEECRMVLSGSLRRTGSYGADTNNVTTSGKGLGIGEHYTNYSLCVNDIRKQIDSTCAPILRKVCTQSRLRSTKVVRASMHSMEPLLTADPQFRVIHLLRDPRAVVASRLAAADESLVGLYSLRAWSRLNRSPYETSAVREATLYCRRAVENLRLAARLSALYPGRIMTVRYEDAIKNLEGHVEEVYRFIGFDRVPSATLAWVRRDKAEKMGRKASPKEKWETQLRADQNEAIVEVCGEFFSLMGDVTPQKRHN